MSMVKLQQKGLG